MAHGRIEGSRFTDSGEILPAEIYAVSGGRPKYPNVRGWPKLYLTQGLRGRLWSWKNAQATSYDLPRQMVHWSNDKRATIWETGYIVEARTWLIQDSSSNKVLSLPAD